MTSAIFRKCHIVQCFFGGSLSQVDFTEAQLEDTEITDLQKQSAKFLGAVIDGVKQNKKRKIRYAEITHDQEGREHTRWGTQEHMKWND